MKTLNSKFDGLRLVHSVSSNSQFSNYFRSQIFLVKSIEIKMTRN